MKLYIDQIKQKCGERFPQLTDLILNLRWLLRRDKSQFGEQGLIKAHVLPKIPQGIYLELGCFQPVIYSNSWLIRNSWSGLHIDANSAIKFQWKVFRRNSKIQIAAVFPKAVYGNVEYIRFPRRNASLNTLSRDFAQNWVNAGYKYSVDEIPAIFVVDLYLTVENEFGQIDLFMTDVEGLDHEIISALLDSGCRPKFILCEDTLGSVHKIMRDHQYLYLGESGPSRLYQLEN
jgi:hypothetical protein